MYTGIEFNGLHSYKDLNLTIADHQIGNPSKIKRKERVPYSNVYYDFSTIYAGQEYDERQLTFVFNIVDSRERNFYIFETEVNNWLMTPNEKTILKYDLIEGYYFLVEAEQANETDYSIDHNWGTITVNFTAYPFKISELEEGHDIWDDFNFLLDYAQITEYDVSGQQSITLYNNGASIIKPTIRASTAMDIIKDGITYKITAGESQSYDFILHKGENRMTIRGNGHISFHFRKELV